METTRIDYMRGTTSFNCASYTMTGYLIYEDEVLFLQSGLVSLIYTCLLKKSAQIVSTNISQLGLGNRALIFLFHHVKPALNIKAYSIMSQLTFLVEKRASAKFRDVIPENANYVKATASYS